MDHSPYMSQRDALFLVELLTTILPSPVSVLEYGAGWSTAVFPQYADAWQAVEHDPVWEEMLRPYLPENVEMTVTTSLSEYLFGPLNHNRTYSLAFVDGIDRESCLRAVLAYRAAPLVLLHDAHRPSAQIRRFPWHYKICDDFYIAGTGEQIERLRDPRFEMREITEPSYQWDPIHRGMPGFYELSS